MTNRTRRTQYALERIAAAAGLVVCSPVLLIAAAAIVLESGRPVFFRQTRMGKHGRPFTLLKLRSMRTGVAGSSITAGGDPRVTRTGAILRRYKLDELPQLWNVVRGDMQFIGARPELPALVDPRDETWRTVLAEEPGITDLSTLIYRNEEDVLAGYADPDRAYREEILPRKLALSAEYSRNRTVRSDFRLLFMTMRYSFFPSGFNPNRIAHLFLEGTR